MSRMRPCGKVVPTTELPSQPHTFNRSPAPGDRAAAASASTNGNGDDHDEEEEEDDDEDEDEWDEALGTMGGPDPLGDLGWDVAERFEVLFAELEATPSPDMFNAIGGLGWICGWGSCGWMI